MNKKNFPSLESIDDGGFNAGAEVMADHTDQVAGYAYEAEQMFDGREADHIVDAIEGAETEIASLESLLEAINDARDVGMEAYSAQFANIQVGAAQKRYGVTGLETAFPSMECFQGRQARMAASVSMESVKETIVKVWAWIKEQFFKFIEMIRKFYRHLTKNLDLIIEEANTVKNIARRMKFDGGDSINLGRHGNKITIDGKIPTDFMSVLQKVSRVNRVPEEAFDKIRTDVETKLTQHKEENESLIASFTQEVPIPAGFELAHQAVIRGVMIGALKIYASPLLPGDRHIVVGVFGNDNRPEAYNLNTRSMCYGRAQTVHEKIERNTATETLGSTEVFSLCQQIVKTAASIKTSRDDMERHLTRTKETIEAIMNKHKGESAASLGMNRIATWFYKNNALYAGALHRHIEGVGYDICVGFLALAKKSVEVNQAKAA